MTEVYADIESLKILRNALQTFSREQSELAEGIDKKVRHTLERLNALQQSLSRQLSRYEDDINYAKRNDNQSDVSYYQSQAGNIRERLRTIKDVIQEFVEQDTRFRQRKKQYFALLGDLTADARNFLQNRILALDSYYALQMHHSAVRVLSSGNTPLMGAAVGMIKRNVGESKRLLGLRGEELAAQILSKKFGLQELHFDKSAHGFDGIYTAPGISMIVMEIKTNATGKLNLSNTLHGKQGSQEYIEHQTELMLDKSHSHWSLSNEMLAERIQSIGAGNVAGMALVVDYEHMTAKLFLRDGKKFSLIREEPIEGLINEDGGSEYGN